MSKILELYNASQKQLGTDKISKDAADALKTPYTTNDLKKVDEQILTAERFKVGRIGELNNVKYSDTVKR
jgi:hypothetical protein